LESLLLKEDRASDASSAAEPLELTDPIQVEQTFEDLFDEPDSPCAWHDNAVGYGKQSINAGGP
jgi:hypothetical protein